MGKRKQKDGSVSRRAFLKKGEPLVSARPPWPASVRGTSRHKLLGTCRRMSSQSEQGTAGLAAAISALDHGASVIMVEENVDIGGHGMSLGDRSTLVAGTSNQRKHGVDDSADQVFLDWVRHDHRQSRYSDRDLVRAFADENAATSNS